MKVLLASCALWLSSFAMAEDDQPGPVTGPGTNGEATASVGRSRDSVSKMVAGVTTEGVEVNGEAMTVSPAGTLRHRIAIDVPEGFNQVQPDLSLVYDSEAGNGPLGVGWNLAGLPHIRRVPADRGVSHGGQDTYAYSTLWESVPSSSNHLVATSDGYRTKTESWQRFTPQGTCGDAPCSWIMEDPSGLRYEFTRGLAHRVDGHASNGADMWALQRIVDVRQNGNIALEIDYTEETDRYTLYPTEIRYGCISTWHGSCAPYKVSFQWEERGDKVRAPIWATKRLRHIKVWSGHGDSPLATHVLGYETSSFSQRSLLTSLTHYGSDNASYTQERFGYTEDESPTRMSLYLEHWSNTNTTLHTLSADFNGDGNDDVVRLGLGSRQFVQVAMGSPTGLGEPAMVFDISDHDFGRGWRGSVGDINGDGYDDLVLHAVGHPDVDGNNYPGLGGAIPSWNQSNDEPRAMVRVLFGSSNGLQQPENYAGNGDLSNWISIVDHSGYYWGIFRYTAWRFVVGDINGDQKDDLILVNLMGRNVAYALGTSDGFGSPVSLNSPGYVGLSSTIHGPILADLNGDGRLELVVTYRFRDTVQFMIASGQDNGLAQPIAHYLDTSGNAQPGLAPGIPVIGDYNGDAMADILLSYSGVEIQAGVANPLYARIFTHSRDYRMYLGRFHGGSYSHGFTDEVVHNNEFLPSPLRGNNTRADWSNLMGDFNGDGLSDIVASYFGRGYNGGQGQRVDVAYGQANGHISDLQTIVLSNPAMEDGVGGTAIWHSHVADIDADGYSDLLRYRSGTTGNYVDVLYGSTQGLIGSWHRLEDGYAQSIPEDHAYKASSISLLTPDVNGDGKPDLILSNFYHTGVALSSEGFADRLNHHKTAYGAVSAVEYTNIRSVAGAVHLGPSWCHRSGDGEITIATDAGCGIADTRARPVVTRITTDHGAPNIFGGNLVRDDGFTYENGRLIKGSYSQRKLLGFASVTKTDQLRRLQVSTKYGQVSPYEHQPLEIIHAALDSNQQASIYRQENITYSEDTTTEFGTGFIKAQKHFIEMFEDGVSGGTIETEFTYDEHGRIILRQECRSDSPCAIEKRQFFDHRFSTYNLGLLSSRTVAVGEEKRVSFYEQHSYDEYDRLNGTKKLVCEADQDCDCFDDISQCLGNGGGRLISTAHSHQYNSTGHLRFVWDSLGRVVEHTYDADFSGLRDRTVHRDGQHYYFDQHRYDEFGRVIEKIEINGTSLLINYDALGRKVVERKSDDQLQVWSYHHIGDPTRQYIRHWNGMANQYTAGNEAVVTRRYFDGLGRVYKIEREGSSGNTKVRYFTQYFSEGKIHKEASAWNKSPSSPDTAWVGVVHDGRGRPETVARLRGYQFRQTQGRLATYVHGAGQVTLQENTRGVDSNGQFTSLDPSHWVTTERKYNTRGNMIEVLDANLSTTQYSYDPLGRLQEVVGPVAVGEMPTTNTPQTAYERDTLGRVTKVKDGKLGLITFEYDDANRVLRKSKETGEATEYIYDQMDRLKERWHVVGSGSSAVRTKVAWYDYDGAHVPGGHGKLAKMNTPHHSIEYLSYDAGGRIAARKVRFADLSTSYTETMVYNGFGLPVSRQLADATQIKYIYDQEGRLQTMQLNGQPVAALTSYYADGQPGQRHLYVRDGTGPHTLVTTHYDRDPDSRLIGQRSVSASFSGTYQDLGYEYDARGNISRIEDHRPLDGAISSNGTYNYSYDNLSRLVGMSNVDGGGEGFAYDAAGNIIIRSQWDKTGESLPLRVDQLITHGQDQLDARTCEPVAVEGAAPDPQSCTGLGYVLRYDAAGRVVEKETPEGVWSYDFDVEDKLLEVRLNGQIKASFKYNSDGERSQKTEYTNGQAISTYYVSPWFEVRRNGSYPALLAVTKKVVMPGYGVVLAETTEQLDGALTEAEIGLRRQLSMTAGTVAGLPKGRRYFLLNHQGSTDVVLGVTGAIDARYVYRSFGGLVTHRSRGSDVAGETFTGQQADTGIGLMYYGSRYYDPAAQRFLSGDPVIPGKGLNPQGFNRYAYTLNNPIRFTDPDGHDPFNVGSPSEVFWHYVAGPVIREYNQISYHYDRAKHYARQVWNSDDKLKYKSSGAFVKASVDGVSMTAVVGTDQGVTVEGGKDGFVVEVAASRGMQVMDMPDGSVMPTPNGKASMRGGIGLKLGRKVAGLSFGVKAIAGMEGSSSRS